jgi:hypothetical protein
VSGQLEASGLGDLLRRCDGLAAMVDDATAQEAADVMDQAKLIAQWCKIRKLSSALAAEASTTTTATGATR